MTDTLAPRHDIERLRPGDRVGQRKPPTDLAAKAQAILGLRHNSVALRASHALTRVVRGCFRPETAGNSFLWLALRA